MIDAMGSAPVCWSDFARIIGDSLGRDPLLLCPSDRLGQDLPVDQFCEVRIVLGLWECTGVRTPEQLSLMEATLDDLFYYVNILRSHRETTCH